MVRELAAATLCAADLSNQRGEWPPEASIVGAYFRWKSLIALTYQIVFQHPGAGFIIALLMGDR